MYAFFVATCHNLDLRTFQGMLLAKNTVVGKLYVFSTLTQRSDANRLESPKHVTSSSVSTMDHHIKSATPGVREPRHRAVLCAAPKETKVFARRTSASASPWASRRPHQRPKCSSRQCQDLLWTNSLSTILTWTKALNDLPSSSS